MPAKRTTKPPSPPGGTPPADRVPASDDRPPIIPDVPLVEVDVNVDPSPHWIRDVTDRWNVRARIHTCRPVGTDASGLLQVVELIGDPGDLGVAERHLRHRSDLRSLTILASAPSRRFVRTVTEMPEPCRRIFEGGAICGTCRFSSAAHEEGRDVWTLVVPRTPEALRAVGHAQAGPKGSPRPVVRIRRFLPASTLTPRQATAIELAYRLGFYEFPRRTNLQEISRILGVRRSTTAEILRRAESKMLAHELGEPERRRGRDTRRLRLRSAG